jgi:hypothetical protein
MIPVRNAFQYHSPLAPTQIPYIDQASLNQYSRAHQRCWRRTSHFSTARVKACHNLTIFFIKFLLLIRKKAKMFAVGMKFRISINY